MAERFGGRNGDPALGRLVQPSPSLRPHRAHPARRAEANHYADIENLDMAA